MSDERQQALQGWAKFLNPEVLRANLIGASIFLAAYETLRASVIDRIHGYFINGFDENGLIVSEDYKTKVLVLDKSPFRASLLWLKGMSVIDDADITLIDQIRQHRNELAHDLPKFLGTADAEVNVRLLTGICELVTRIDRWWIKEVELTIDPDYDGREIADHDITSGNMLFIHLMLRIAAGEDSAAFWEEFRKRVGGELPAECNTSGPP